VDLILYVSHHLMGGGGFLQLTKKNWLNLSNVPRN
jgi:hypothetical protein